MISINRSEGTKAMRTMLKQAKQKIIYGNSIVIFPEGTRKKPGEPPSYKTGIAGIYKETEAEILPVALNSGCVWPKNKPLSCNKTITISILKQISPGLNKEDFLNILENNIYSELDKIN